MSFYSWNTKKIKKGFQFDVKKITSLNKPTKEGYYAKTQTVKTGVLPTRARAKAQAQRWSRYLNSKVKK